MAKEQLKGLPFRDARKLIETMSLEELQEELELEAPKLLPWAGLMIFIGLTGLLLGFLNPVFIVLGLACLTYGFIAATINRNRGFEYRQSCYRFWVENQIEENE